MKEYQWTVPGTDGLDHQVSAKLSIWKRKIAVTVDGRQQVIKPTSRQRSSGVADLTIPAGGKTCRLVAIGTQADLVVDGQYLCSGQPYFPHHTMPRWVWIFWLLCLVLCFVGGILAWAIGLLAAVHCGRIAISPFRDKRSKLLACANTAVASWAITAVLTLVLTLLTR